MAYMLSITEAKSRAFTVFDTLLEAEKDVAISSNRKSPSPLEMGSHLNQSLNKGLLESNGTPDGITSILMVSLRNCFFLKALATIVLQNMGEKVSKHI
jgi:hypothetical protein